MQRGGWVDRVVLEGGQRTAAFQQSIAPPPDVRVHGSSFGCGGQRGELEDREGITVGGVARSSFPAVSENNFPTAAGMASSASGYCCLGAVSLLSIGIIPAIVYQCF